MKQFFQRRESWIAALLVVGIGLLAFAPLLHRFGFYRDDWYQLWAGHALGADSIITLFSIDRPVMGFLYAGTYALFGESALAWNVYSLALRLAGALAFLWLMRQLWPEERTAATTAAVLFVVYPGFLQQPNANTFSNQLTSYACAVASLALTVAAGRATARRSSIALTAAAILTGLANWLLYEYMIGLEGVRLVLLGLLAWRSEHGVKPAVRRTMARWLPYLVPLAAYLVWRMLLFKAFRAAVDVGGLLQQYTGSPLRMLGRVGVETVRDFIEAGLSGWLVPAYQLNAFANLTDSLVAFVLAGAAIAAFVAYSRAERGARADAGTDAAKPKAAREMIIVGGLSILMGALPVILAGRDVRWESGFDRYTLHLTLGISLLIVGTLLHFGRRPLPVLAFSLLIGLGVSTHYLNAVDWARAWEDQRQMWWQLTWRAPGLEPGTVLLMQTPDFAFFEDYETWGPANLIYYPEARSPILATEILTEHTAELVRLGTRDVRGMRKLIEFPRDFNQSLLAVMPSRGTCLHVLESASPELPADSESLVRSMVDYSHAERIVTEVAPTIPPETIFGSEPEHTWCWYYETAALARQRGDWQAIAALGEQVEALGLRPLDRSEWMPFFHAYINLSLDEPAELAAIWIRDREQIRHSLCDHLSQTYFVDEAAFLRGQEMLCAFGPAP
jgi:hypothetical protein